ncbi:MAG: AmmeMemoRadiSam system protein B [Candidatus Aminicenantes bacterium]|nr:AmmeMemoRadiSam system protein B [Candidatus Aminicenantes bacterium]
MNRKILICLLIAVGSAAGAARVQDVRAPVWAGSFYDNDKARLSAQVDAYLENVKDLPITIDKVHALIIPHAGYVYSGQTAAYAYRLVRGKPYETVIIIGVSHRYPLDGCSIYLKGGFATPLGVAQVDEEVAARIAKASGFSYVPQAHAEEHSVEVQVPFIQRALPGAKIVPILMGYPNRRHVNALAEGLAAVGSDKKVLIVASTDLSHYLSKKDANKADAETISLIRNINANTLLNKCAKGENIMCGGGGVAATLIALKKTGEPEIKVLRYSDSSDVSGDEARVVGYLAAAVTLKPGPGKVFSLSSAEKKELLDLAREAVRKFVSEKKVIDYQTRDPNLLAERGVFVTLKKKGELRGCIGFIEPVAALYETVIHSAIYAASEDPRFPPVKSEELKDLDIEVSVLSPLTRVEDPGLVQVGKHGLVMEMGGQRGLLLPQVAVENGWSRETFLNQACVKAGLAPDAWKKGAEISIFEAIIFP